MGSSRIRQDAGRSVVGSCVFAKELVARVCHVIFSHAHLHVPTLPRLTRLTQRAESVIFLLSFFHPKSSFPHLPSHPRASFSSLLVKRLLVKHPIPWSSIPWSSIQPSTAASMAPGSPETQSTDTPSSFATPSSLADAAREALQNTEGLEQLVQTLQVSLASASRPLSCPPRVANVKHTNRPSAQRSSNCSALTRSSSSRSRARSTSSSSTAPKTSPAAPPCGTMSTVCSRPWPTSRAASPA